MKTYRTIKRSAGRHNFGEGQCIDLPDDEAELLIAGGAIVPANTPEPKVAEAEKPKPQPKRTAKETAKEPAKAKDE